MSDTPDLTKLDSHTLAQLRDRAQELLRDGGHAGPVNTYRCPGDEDGPCDFRSWTLAAVCEKHGTHVV